MAAPTAGPRLELRNSLVGPTIKHAVTRIPAYREYQSLVEAVSTIENLPLLPVIDKSAMLRALDSYRDPDAPTAAAQHTGGTSRETLVLHRGPDELEYIRRFFTMLTLPASLDVSHSPLCISVLGNFHGDATPIPYPAPVFTLNLNDPYWDIETVVSEPWRLLGVMNRNAIVVGLESQLRILTCRLVEKGFDFGRSCVTNLYSTGDLITRRLRSWYEDNWRVPLINRYSMTEMFGGANLCEECGHLHMDPHVVGEVLDPFTRQPITSGCGVLVITCLYPFVQKQPIIRYWTGDLVTLGPRTCPVDMLAFDLEGRAASCLYEATPEGVRLLLGSANLYDILDDYADVASSQMFRTMAGVTDHSALGHLKANVRSQARDGVMEIGINVETRYTSYMYPAHSRRLCHEIYTRLVDRHPWLAQRIAARSAMLTVATALPGTLASFLPDETE